MSAARSWAVDQLDAVADAVDFEGLELEVPGFEAPGLDELEPDELSPVPDDFSEPDVPADSDPVDAGFAELGAPDELFDDSRLSLR